MSAFETNNKNETAEKNKKTEVIKTNASNIINEPINTINEDTEIINECIIKSSTFEDIGPNDYKIKKSICKIKIQTEKGLKKGSGFLLKFDIDQEFFYCLMSNEHVINNNILYSNNTIYIDYDNELKIANIKLDEKERYMKSFRSINLD